jgi:DGQHR domain-containing protein
MSPTKKLPADPKAQKHKGELARALTVSASGFRQGDTTLYMFKERASVLYGALSINRREPDKDEGYQRVLSPARVESIKRYLQEKRSIPGAIIVNLDSATFDESKNELSIPTGPDQGWVIDGQHRLAGAAMAAKEGVDIELPVVAFIGLTPEAKIEQFITINREGKNVPTSLYLDLLHNLPRKRAADAPKERAADIATQLRKDENSPFFERIVVTTAPKSGQTISLTNFVRKISPHVAREKGMLGPYTEPEQAQIISNYYQGLRQVFPKEYGAKDSMFFKTLGFGALWNVFPVVFSLTMKNQYGFAVADVATIFRAIEDTDFATWSQFGTGDQAERTAADDLRTSLLLAFQSDAAKPSTIRL